ncbi:DUF4998 domain-containing protein [Chitinophaga sp.]|uniref:DUF4998 domain-containing protein n=1 Tax=Chitinophaga sp. TaxID=1869181 RepID=UPI002F923CC1
MRKYPLVTKLLLPICSVFLFIACSRKATDFKDFLGNTEIQYPGVVSGIAIYPGNGRLAIGWKPSPDPSISKYVLYWNSRQDSVVINATSHKPTDTVLCLIPGLSEYAYTFFLYSYDRAGNRSIVTEIDNAHAYGSIYRSTLHNRLPDVAKPYEIREDGTVTLFFSTPDTINIDTRIKYTNAAGVEAFAAIPGTADSINLPGYKAGQPVMYQSSYIPGRYALDTFYTNNYDTFPDIYKLVACDKSLFQEHDLPNDMGIYQSDTRVSRLWDGSVGPQSYPDIFHSDDQGSNTPLPRTLTFDMGKIYNLGRIEETGRNCCNNPSEFEVWGIADITNAATALKSTDPGWAAEMSSKGWTLLTTAVRGDDGNNAMKFDFIPQAPPARYIRIRVLHTVNNSNSVNMSEITMFGKQ